MVFITADAHLCRSDMDCASGGVAGSFFEVIALCSSRGGTDGSCDADCDPQGPL